MRTSAWGGNGNCSMNDNARAKVTYSLNLISNRRSASVFTQPDCMCSKSAACHLDSGRAAVDAG